MKEQKKEKIKISINRTVAMFITIIILVVLNLLIGFNGYTNKEENYQKQISVYEDSTFDFVCPSPSKQQVIDLSHLDHISNVTGYYQSEFSGEVKGKSFSKQNILLLDDIKESENTIFNSQRLLEGNDVIDNVVYIDDNFASRFDMNLGDVVSISYLGSSINYTVSKVFKSSNNENGLLMVEYSGAIKDKIESNRDKPLTYSACTITSKNISNTRSYLKDNYKAMGLLKDRSEFENDEQYQIHYNSFYNTDYTKLIEDNEMHLSSIIIEEKDSVTTNLIIFIVISIVSALLIAIINIILAIKIDKINVFIEKIRKGSLITSYTTFYKSNFIQQSIIITIVSVISIILLCNVNTSYVSGTIMYLFAIGSVSMLILSSFLSCILINNYLIKNMPKKKKV